MSLTEKVEQFFYYEDDLTNKILEWAKDRCETFIEKDSQTYEHPQQHMVLFQEYCVNFEQMITGFLQINGINVIDFYTEVKKEYEASQGRHRSSAQNTFASVLLGATDFHSFCDMMRDVNKGEDVVFCPPLISMDDDDEKLDCNIGSEFKAESKTFDDEDNDREKDMSYKGNDDYGYK